MIGHALLTFTAKQEDRVLTTVMSAAPRGPCLLEAAFWRSNEQMPWPTVYRQRVGFSVGYRYDSLCERFGCQRINTAIRNRILANRVWRALQGVVLQEERRVLPEVTV